MYYNYYTKTPISSCHLLLYSQQLLFGLLYACRSCQQLGVSTSVLQFRSVCVYVFLLRVILINIQSSQPSRASRCFLKTCYLQLYTLNCYTVLSKESSQGSSKIKLHVILVYIIYGEFFASLAVMPQLYRMMSLSMQQVKYFQQILVFNT